MADFQCMDCLTSTLYKPMQCSHCLFPYCYMCLAKHQHGQVKDDLLDLIEMIDTILVQFVDRAHSDTEWTMHLTHDQERLKQYVRSIEKVSVYCTVSSIPKLDWLTHVDEVICKYSDAVYESCCKCLKISSPMIKS